MGPFCLAAFVVALVIAILQGPSWWWALSYFCHFILFTFGVGFGLHRCVAHQAIDPPKWLLNTAALIGALAQVGSPVSWRTIHLLHHSHSDRERDPQSPARLGWKVIFGYTAPQTMGSIVNSLLATGALRDSFLIFLHKNYYLVTASYCLISYVLGGSTALIYIAILPMGLSFMSLGLLVYFAHGKYGYHNFNTGDQSRNIWWLWPLTFGENWHNNHHHQPSNPHFRAKFFEIDVIYIYVGFTKLFRSRGRNLVRQTP